MNIPLTDYSTEKARAIERLRRRLRRELLADWQRTRQAISAEKLNAVLGISDAEWAAAVARDAEAGNGEEAQ